MSRYDGKLEPAGDLPIDAAALLAALGSQARLQPHERQDAIVRFLSAGEGWRDAARLLGGAFAGEDKAPSDGAGQATGLSGGKEG